MGRTQKSKLTHIAENIRHLRTQNSLTQKQLAEKLYRSESAIRMWELAKSEPDNDTLIALASTFNVPVDDILGVKFVDPPRLDTVLCHVLKLHYDNNDFRLCARQLSKEQKIPFEEIIKINNGYLEAKTTYLSKICDLFNLPADIIWMKVYVPSEDEIFTDEENRRSADILLEDCTQMITMECYNRLFQRCAEEGIHVKIFDDFVDIVRKFSKLQIKASAPLYKKATLQTPTSGYRAAKDGDANSERCDLNVSVKVGEYKETSSTDEKPFK